VTTILTQGGHAVGIWDGCRRCCGFGHVELPSSRARSVGRVGGERIEPGTAPLPQSPFVPPTAEPNRKAKLQALVPKLDALFAERTAETGTTGAAVGIVLQGEVVYVRGFGVRQLETKQPVDADSVFRIGSVSKTITALAVLKLRDQGRVVLDAPAATYVPALASPETNTGIRTWVSRSLARSWKRRPGSRSPSSWRAKSSRRSGCNRRDT
jgi:hypothetical protein